MNKITSFVKKIFAFFLSKKGFIVTVGAILTFYVSTLIPFCRSSILPSMNVSFFTKTKLKIIGDSETVWILKNKKDKNIYVNGDSFVLEFTNQSDYPITVKDITFDITQVQSMNIEDIDYTEWIADNVYYGSAQSSYLTRIVDIPKFNKNCSVKVDFYDPENGGNPSKFELIVYKVPPYETEYIPIQLDFFSQYMEGDVSDYLKFFKIEIVLLIDIKGESQKIRIKPNYGVCLLKETYQANTGTLDRFKSVHESSLSSILDDDDFYYTPSDFSDENESEYEDVDLEQNRNSISNATITFTGNVVAVINDADGWTNIREEKNHKSQIIGRVYENEEFLVEETNELWWKIKTKSGQIGYMNSKLIKVIKR